MSRGSVTFSHNSVNPKFKMSQGSVESSYGFSIQETLRVPYMHIHTSTLCVHLGSIYTQTIYKHLLYIWHRNDGRDQ